MRTVFICPAPRSSRSASTATAPPPTSARHGRGRPAARHRAAARRGAGRLRRLGLRRVAARAAGAAAGRDLRAAGLHRGERLRQRRFRGAPGLAGDRRRAARAGARGRGGEPVRVRRRHAAADHRRHRDRPGHGDARGLRHAGPALPARLRRRPSTPSPPSRSRTGATAPPTRGPTSRSEVTAADVDNSRPVADPLRLLHCCPNSDGAAAVLLTSAGVAAELGHPAHPHPGQRGALRRVPHRIPGHDLAGHHRARRPGGLRAGRARSGRPGPGRAARRIRHRRAAARRGARASPSAAPRTRP